MGLGFVAPPAPPSQNLLDNPGFELWQGPPQAQSAVVVTAGDLIVADQWHVAASPSTGSDCTATVTRESTVVDAGSTYSMKVVWAPNTSTGVTQLIDQRVGEWPGLVGKLATFSIRVYMTGGGGGTMYAALGNDSANYATGPASAATGGWVTLAVSGVVQNARLHCRVYMPTTVAVTGYFDNATLCVGGVAMPYQPLKLREEVARCQRYREIVPADYPAGNGMFNWAAYCPVANQQLYGYWPFAVHKNVFTPTMTILGTWSFGNAHTLNANADTAGFQLQMQSTAAGMADVFNGGTGAQLQAEAAV